MNNLAPQRRECYQINDRSQYAERNGFEAGDKVIDDNPSALYKYINTRI